MCAVSGDQDHLPWSRDRCQMTSFPVNFFSWPDSTAPDIIDTSPRTPAG